MNRAAPWLITGLIAIAIATAAALFAWQKWRASGQPPAAPEVAAAPPAAPAATEPVIQNPIEQAKPDAALRPEPRVLPSLEQSDALMTETLTGLLGRESVQKFLRLDGIVRRVVITIDNLPREKAAVRLWPVSPTPGPFAVSGEADRAQLESANYRRYAPFVRFVESIDTGRAVALYVQIYPLAQRAYAELGYPNHYFNDRLVAVIDHLLATPDVAGPIALTRPWIMYAYADPALESRSAGQKTLIRMGSENAARLKAKLREVRRQIASAPVRP